MVQLEEERMNSLQLPADVLLHIDHIARALLERHSEAELIEEDTAYYVAGTCRGCSGSCKGTCQGNCDGACVIK